MISLCYLILCVYLLFSFDQAETFLNTKKWPVRKEKSNLSFTSITVENQHECLSNIVSPYWNLTYDVQLKKKQKRSTFIVDMIERSMRNITRISIELLQIIPSPVTKAYRNRDEFFIKRGVDGNPKTVGLPVGSQEINISLTIPPTKIVTIKESHMRVAQVFQDFIRLSPLSACVNLFDGGHWRAIHVRSNEEGDIMASVIVQPYGYTNKTIQKHKQALTEYFSQHLPNISLFHQQCPKIRCNRYVAPFTLLYGKVKLMETLNGYKFNISNDTPFHINKWGAEVLYNTIIRTAKLKSRTSVLDICHDSGTMSIMASKFVKKSFLFDGLRHVINNAKQCAKFNNVYNINFFLGKVDLTMKSILKGLQSSDIVAIAKAGENGLDYGVIGQIRRCNKISKLVYHLTDLNIRKCIKNIVYLCSNKSLKFHPFILSKAIPLDLLPQTTRIDFILIFERLRGRKYLI